MRTDLVVYHLDKSGLIPSAILPLPGFLVWETCLRRIYLGFESLAPAGEVSHFGDVGKCFRGAEAYSFLLEVVCGLHSPIVGETEVFGQFRAFVQQEMDRNATLRSPLSDLSTAIYEDTKRIRAEHLSGLGKVSYGSVSRRLLKGVEEVLLVGAGQLAQEVVTWLPASVRVTVFSRRPEAQKGWLGERGESLGLECLAGRSLAAQQGLVIAAPITSREFARWSPEGQAGLVLDLRDTSDQDRLHRGANEITLSAVFNEFEERKRALQEQSDQARRSISERSWRRWDGRLVSRPFGWDDVCA